MALPIGCTPVLKGKEAAELLERLKKEESERRQLVSTPKLGSVRKALLADARKKK